MKKNSKKPISLKFLLTIGLIILMIAALYVYFAIPTTTIKIGSNRCSDGLVTGGPGFPDKVLKVSRLELKKYLSDLEEQNKCYEIVSSTVTVTIDKINSCYQNGGSTLVESQNYETVVVDREELDTFIANLIEKNICYEIN